jgi:glutaredoxin
MSRVKPREDLHFVLYTRRGCHLCETVLQELSKAQTHYRFALEKKDVDANADLVAQFGDCVPVVAVNGKVRFRGAVNPVLLRRLLESPNR